MQALSTQLTLGITLKNEATFENFYPGKNAQIIATLKKTSIGKGERIIYLCGNQGFGCSHLLQASCHEASNAERSSVYLPLADLIHLDSDILFGFEALDLVCVDDLDQISGKPQWEEALFHLYNRIYDLGGCIILAANVLPKALALSLPDLTSRLSWGVVYQLQILDDQEKLTVLMTRAKQRGLFLAADVARYILTHYPRDMGALFVTLDRLDAASLAAQRRLTIPFVKEVLG